ncbi:MAG: winged helix-turn-helix domain-containing protein [Candidatus Diapherotrites archaeon]|nr:winged helix-turn-helix domain-containing protein [Candidatus Diapherotrites archaeon]
MRVLQQLVDSKSKILLLGKLLDKSQAFSVSELSRLADLPKATVSVIVSEWEKAGLVLSEQQGRNKLVRLNSRFYLLPDLKKIFKKTANFQEPLFNRLKSMKALKAKNVKVVVVFGSRLGVNFSHQSDLDVLIVVENKNCPLAEKIVEEFVKATNGTNIRFSPIILDAKETRGRWIEKDAFIKNIFRNGKILKGSDFVEHLQAAP